MNEPGSSSGEGGSLIYELRNAHARLLHLLEETDDKAETVIRLGVFAVAGIAVFLTYAARPDSSIEFFFLPKLIFVLGAVLQFISFLSVLESYGVLGAPRNVEFGAAIAPRRKSAPESRTAAEETLENGYRRAIRRNNRTFSRMTDRLSLAAFLLVASAFLYFLGIFILVQP